MILILIFVQHEKMLSFFASYDIKCNNHSTINNCSWKGQNKFRKKTNPKLRIYTYLATR